MCERLITTGEFLSSRTCRFRARWIDRQNERRANSSSAASTLRSRHRREDFAAPASLAKSAAEMVRTTGVEKALYWLRILLPLDWLPNQA